jgi:hypothetical protein
MGRALRRKTSRAAEAFVAAAPMAGRLDVSELRAVAMAGLLDVSESRAESTPDPVAVAGARFSAPRLRAQAEEDPKPWAAAFSQTGYHMTGRRPLPESGRRRSSDTLAP